MRTGDPVKEVCADLAQHRCLLEGKCLVLNKARGQGQNLLMANPSFAQSPHTEQAGAPQMCLPRAGWTEGEGHPVLFTKPVL